MKAIAIIILIPAVVPALFVALRLANLVVWKANDRRRLMVWEQEVWGYRAEEREIRALLDLRD